MRHTCILSMAAPQKAALALLAAGEDGITWRHANVSARQRAPAPAGLHPRACRWQASFLGPRPRELNLPPRRPLPRHPASHPPLAGGDQLRRAAAWP